MQFQGLKEDFHSAEEVALCSPKEELVLDLMNFQDLLVGEGSLAEDSILLAEMAVLVLEEERDAGRDLWTRKSK